MSNETEKKKAEKPEAAGMAALRALFMPMSDEDEDWSRLLRRDSGLAMAVCIMSVFDREAERRAAWEAKVEAFARAQGVEL